MQISERTQARIVIAVAPFVVLLVWIQMTHWQAAIISVVLLVAWIGAWIDRDGIELTDAEIRRIVARQERRAMHGRTRITRLVGDYRPYMAMYRHCAQRRQAVQPAP
jgi:hypothetical protein